MDDPLMRQLENLIGELDCSKSQCMQVAVIVTAGLLAAQVRKLASAGLTRGRKCTSVGVISLDSERRWQNSMEVPNSLAFWTSMYHVLGYRGREIHQV